MWRRSKQPKLERSPTPPNRQATLQGRLLAQVIRNNSRQSNWIQCGKQGKVYDLNHDRVEGGGGDDDMMRDKMSQISVEYEQVYKLVEEAGSALD